jgi:hypothetical protein
MADVFISYARADDEAYAHRLHENLGAHGVDVWWDRAAMESRGRTFLQEIRDAIERVERVIAVVGPRALESEYVQVEWAHALLFSKAVVPVLRHGTYDDVPPALARFHCVDARDARPSDQACAELLRILGEPVPPLGPLRTLVPSLPPHFLPRGEDLAGLNQLVLADVHRPVAISGARQVTALTGMGGTGKSVLAAAFARLADTRRAFADGIIWLALGQSPEPVQVVSHALEALDGAVAQDGRFEELLARLARLLADRCCLLVLDDAWDVSLTSHFRDAMGPRCRLLLTTRDRGIATAFGANEHAPGVLPPNAALRLLADWTQQRPEELPADARAVADACGYLPFALALCGALAREGTPWTDLRDALQEADLSFLEKRLPNYPHASVWAALKVSVEALARSDANAVARYQQLAVFPNDTGLPERALLHLWADTGRLSERDARKLLIALDRMGLLRLDGRPPDSTIWLHDLQYAYLRAAADDLPALHDQVLTSYRRQCAAAWIDLPDDGYSVKHLAYHLAGAGRVAEMRHLLRFVEVTARFEGTGYSSVYVLEELYWGILSFNFVNGTLSRLLLDLRELVPGAIDEAFGDGAEELTRVLHAPREEQTAWAKRITMPGGRRLVEPWNSRFATLGANPMVQLQQLRHAYEFALPRALHAARKAGFRSEWGLALCYDSVVQLGRVRADALEAFVAEAQTDPPADERAARIRLAGMIAARTSPGFRNHVRDRLLAIATAGESLPEGHRLRGVFGLSERDWGAWADESPPDA